MQKKLDVKTNVRPTNVLLQKSVPQPTAASITQPQRDTDEKYFMVEPADAKTPSPNVDVSKILSQLRVDITKLSPETDAAAIKAAERTVSFLLGSGTGGSGDSKHYYQSATNVELTNANQNCPASLTYAIAGFAAGTAPGFAINSQIFSGNTESTRLGRMIRCKHCTIRMKIVWQSQSAVSALYAESFQPVRITIFEDLQPLAIAPTNSSTSTITTSGLDLFVNPSSAATAELLIAPWNPTTHGFRYKIHRDEVINAPSNATAINISPGAANALAATACSFHEIHLDLHDSKVVYGDDNTTGTTLVISGEYFICFTVDNTVQGIQPYIDIVTDTNYYDAIQ